MREVRLPDGRERLVRHGHGPERLVQTGIGPVAVQCLKLRDRGANDGGASDAGAERIRFTSAILLRWARRKRTLDALLPILPPARGFDVRQTPWLDVRLRRGARSLAGEGRPEPGAVDGGTAAGRVGGGPRALAAALPVGPALRACRSRWRLPAGPHGAAGTVPDDKGVAETPVLIGATPEGKKELLDFQVGMRDSAQSWHELLVDLKARGLAIAPELATGDGALGF